MLSNIEVTRMKNCTQCGNSKSLNDFHFRNKQKGILRSDCKECRSKHSKKYHKENLLVNQDYNRERNTWVRFNITLEEKQRVMSAGNHLCPILNIPFKDTLDECCDHKHSATERGRLGSFRGVLSRCANSALGAFEENTNSIRLAIICIARARSADCIKSLENNRPICEENRCEESLKLIKKEQKGCCCISGLKVKLHPLYDEYSGIFIGYVSAAIKQALGQIHYNTDALLNMIKYLEVYEASYKAWAYGTDPIFDSAPLVAQKGEFDSK